jgi:ethanolamine ammonia-lyase small subunit
VHSRFDAERIASEIRAAGLGATPLQSAAGDRTTYLRQPDLGRRLGAQSREQLSVRPAAPIDVLFIIGDGLSATAVNAHAVPLLLATIARLRDASLHIGPIAIVEGARVAIGDEIGGILGAEIAAILIGERPGLSAADSLGVYVTWQPTPGTVDARRNCISNIRPEGLPIPQAAEQLATLLSAARQYRITGVELSKCLASESSRLVGPEE